MRRPPAEKLIGEKRVRTRVLDDAELAAVWQAAAKTSYPIGPYYRLLLLTGARKTEASGATWSEFDLDAGTWTVPEARFKSGVQHRIPLSTDAVELLRSLPRLGELVFSFDGKKPINGFSKSKARIDGLVDETLAARAIGKFMICGGQSARGSPASASPTPWPSRSSATAGRVWRASTISMAMRLRCAMRSSCGLRGCGTS